MKKWVEADKYKPTDDREILAHFLNGETLIVFFDGDEWCDAMTCNILKEPLYWMDIPVIPGE
jgi:hypothetical protein